MFGTGAVEVLNLDLLEGFDILDDAKFFDLLKRALRGEFDFIVSGTPCCTFSAALAADQRRAQRRHRAALRELADGPAES